MVSSINKTSNIQIIRRSEYSRKDNESIAEIDISNKDSALSNNMFNDLITIHEKNKKNKKPPQEEIINEEENDDSNSENLEPKSKITDFYI